MAQFKKAIGALFCVLCLVVPLTSGESVSFKNCTIDTMPVAVKGVDISPFPVRFGQTVTVTISASADKEIAGGFLEIDTTRGGVTTSSENLELCITTTCPITAGAFTISYTFKSLIIPGENEVYIQAYYTDRRPLICITFVIDEDI